jgi:hypothetical protein
VSVAASAADSAAVSAEKRKMRDEVTGTVSITSLIGRNAVWIESDGVKIKTAPEAIPGPSEK